MARTIRFPPHPPGVFVLSSVPPAIALVGAGPRGTSVLERLCASVPELAPGTAPTVHVVDPSPAGPGRVWRTDQAGELLMNTVACQVTVFTDDSVRCEGPVRPGPSLHAWAVAHGHPLGPDDYPTRALYGRYLAWAFDRTVRGAPPGTSVHVHRARAIRLEDEAPAPGPGGDAAGVAAPRQRLVLDDGTVLGGLGAVVLAQGHLPEAPDAEGARLAAHAARHGLRHLPPANPADLDLSPIAPGEPVLLRGLGLTFFDHMALLTEGRSGRFVRTGRDAGAGPGAGRGADAGAGGGADAGPAAGALVYLPSGREPRLYAGSRRGVPYQARGDNEKGASRRHEPLLLTGDVVAAFRKRAEAGDPPDFDGEIRPLVALEVETVYYEALLRRRGERDTAGFRSRFLTLRDGASRAAVLDAYGVASADRWCWERIADPAAGETFRSPAAHRAWLLERLRADAAEAALGNVSGPLKAALDVLRDLRNEVRAVVDHAGLPGASRRDHLDRRYTPLNAFLSIGPPRRRVEEMAALVEAGVLDVVGPGLEVRTEPGAFVGLSPRVPGSAVAATTLIEARLPHPDLRRADDALLAHLLATGGCRTHVVDGYDTGGLDVTERPYHLVDARGVPHPRRFALGVPTEGVHWVTAAGARPGVDSVTLSDADAVARGALRAATQAAPAPAPSPTHSPAPSPAPALAPPPASRPASRPNVELASTP
ncbi:FAD/NAD(P)-binding domain-containing protein [Streptomyces sp. DH12]|uniref:FAD/NAD(P)-binding protein n=1 Tax=Streptomyces sp. DH12 TaxID=2857010 RepID=UPI001E37A80B|nr:FAD/NAD(P)-binding protein [Streptomyces sp. DH12]